LSKIKNEMEENVSQYGLHGNRIYSVVIVITDGNCHDMEKTKELLVKMSTMPFSAVVVGVGDSNFEDMEILDADLHVLVDKDGNEAVRDIV
jgi:Copine